MKARLLQLLRNRRAQSVWEQLHRLSLVGMNYWASNLSSTGEMDALRLMAQKLAKTQQPVIFDVGANVGDFAEVCLSAFDGRCIIHAFEPSPRTFRLLQTKLQSRLAENLYLHNVGFSDSEGEQMLYSSEPGSTIASVHELERPIRPFRDEFSEHVSLTTIDQFCKERGIERIHLLKLDIEGHEFHALQGASRMLAEGRIGFIQFEFGENNVASRTYLSDFNRLLSDRYSIYRVVPGGLKSWTYEGGRSEIFATMNYLCELKGEPGFPLAGPARWIMNRVANK